MPVNDPPVVVNQVYNGTEDTTLVVNASQGLLKGSSDADNDLLVVVNTTKPRYGNLTVQGDGSFVYVPNLNFNGQDSFQYVVMDGQGGFGKGIVTLLIGETTAGDPDVVGCSWP